MKWQKFPTEPGYWWVWFPEAPYGPAPIAIGPNRCHPFAWDQLEVMFAGPIERPDCSFETYQALFGPDAFTEYDQNKHPAISLSAWDAATVRKKRKPKAKGANE